MFFCRCNQIPLFRSYIIFTEYLNEEDRDKVVKNGIALGDCGSLDEDAGLFLMREHPQEIFVHPKNE